MTSSWLKEVTFWIKIYPKRKSSRLFTRFVWLTIAAGLTVEDNEV
jgi:hypothetical protein